MVHIEIFHLHRIVCDVMNSSIVLLANQARMLPTSVSVSSHFHQQPGKSALLYEIQAQGFPCC